MPKGATGNVAWLLGRLALGARQEPSCAGMVAFRPTISRQSPLPPARRYGRAVPASDSPRRRDGLAQVADRACPAAMSSSGGWGVAKPRIAVPV